MLTGLQDKTYEYVQLNWRLILYCLVISLIAFGFEIFNVSISIDEEVASLTNEPLQAWLQMDRWGMYGLNWLLQDGPPLPYFNMLLGIAANLATFLICLEIWTIKQGPAKYLAAIFALTHPTIAFVYAFNQSQYGYYLGLLLAVLGVRVLVHSSGRPIKILLTIALWVGALSIYQSVIFVAPVVYLLFLLAQSLKNQGLATTFRKNIHHLAMLLTGLLAAVFLHEMISHMIREALHIGGRYHTIEDFYSGAFLNSYDPLFVIKETIAQLIGHRWYVGYLSGLILLAGVLFLIKSILILPVEILQKTLLLLLLTGAILSPFIFVMITSEFWPARTMMALPVMIGGVVYLAWQHTPRLAQPWIIVLASLCFIGFVQSNTRLFYTDYVSWQNDKLLANRIIGVLETNYGDFLGTEKIPIIFVGHPIRSELPIRRKEETFGGSVLEWDRGSDHRILSLFKLIGCDYFRLADRSEIERVKMKAMAMPNWPSSASIAKLEEIIVVKFSDDGESGEEF